MTAKVADLGLAREIDIDNGMTLMAGTPKWYPLFLQAF